MFSIELIRQAGTDSIQMIIWELIVMSSYGEDHILSVTLALVSSSTYSGLGHLHWVNSVHKPPRQQGYCSFS